MKKFTQIFEVYKDKYSQTIELNISGSAGFQLKNLNELDLKKNQFTSLIKINCSDNLLNKLFLKGYPTLKYLIAQKNMIIEISLSLSSLIELDLSFNFINKVPDLTCLSSLLNLNLSHNLIEKIEISDFVPVKSTLKEILIGFNKLSFEALSFIAFVEGLKTFKIESLSLEGNDFIDNNPALTNTYKLYVVASLKTLTIFNEDKISLSLENVNPEEISMQIVELEKGIKKRLRIEENEEERKEESISPNRNMHYFTSLKNLSFKNVFFKDINKIMENLNLKGGNDQTLIMFLFENLNKILISQDEFDIKSEQEIQEEQNNYAVFLMNCLSLIELNDGIEKTLYKTIGEFSLFNNGIFCKKSFDFFESLIKSSVNRTDLISSTLKESILYRLDKLKENIPFKILQTVIDFFQKTNIQFDEIYISLIGKVLLTLLTVSFNSCFQLNKKEEEGEVQEFLVCLDFIRQFLQIEFDNEISNQLSNEAKQKDLDFITRLCKINDEEDENDKKLLSINSFQSDNKKEGHSEIGSELNSSHSFEEKNIKNYELEFGFNINEIDEKSTDDVTNEEYNENKVITNKKLRIVGGRESSKLLNGVSVKPSFSRVDFYDNSSHSEEEENNKKDYKTKNKVSTKSNIEKVDKTMKIHKTDVKNIDDYYNYLISNNIYSTQTDEINDSKIGRYGKITDAGIELTDNLYDFGIFSLDIKKLIFYELNDKEISHWRKKYKFLFELVIFKLYPIFQNVDFFFKNKKYLKVLSKSLDLIDVLANTFTYHIESLGLTVKEVEILRGKISLPKKNLFTSIGEYLRTIISEYLNDISSIDQIIISEYLHISDEKPNEHDILNIKEIKQVLSKILSTYGALLLISSDGRLKQEMNKDVNERILSVMVISNNDNFILKGSCEYLLNLLNDERIVSDMMLTAKVFNKANEFKQLILFIDNNELRYKNMYDKLIKYDKGLKRNVNYSFDNLKNQDIIETIISIVRLFRRLAYFTTISSVINELAINCCNILINIGLHEIIGNLLKIRDDTIRKLVVEFFYFQNDKYINIKVLNQIVDIISNFSSVTAGETEIILSMVYLIFNRIALDSSRLTDNRTIEVLSTGSVLALDFLIQNNNRNPMNKDEIIQKNKLTSTLLLYLNTCWRLPGFINNFKKEKFDSFRTLLQYDNSNTNQNYYLPLEIERCQFGNYCGYLFENIVSQDPINPYTWVFARIIIKLADLMCNFEEFSYNIDYSLKMESLLDALQKEISLRTKLKICNEQFNWHIIKTNLKEDVYQKKSPEEFSKERYNRLMIYKRLSEDIKNVDYSKYILEEINEFNIRGNESKPELNNKSVENTATVSTSNIGKISKEEDSFRLFRSTSYTRLLLSELIQEQLNFSAYFPTLLLFLLGSSSYLNERNIIQYLSKKFDYEFLYKEREIKELLSGDSNSNDKKDLLFKNPIYNIKNLNENSIKTTISNNHNSENSYKSYDSNILQGVSNLFLSCDSVLLSNKLRKPNIQMTFFEEDLLFYEKYGFSSSNLKFNSEENVNNPHLRSILISGLLRSCYALLISPSIYVRHTFIETLLCENSLKDLILLCHTTYIFEYNIFVKMLMTMSSLFNNSTLPIIKSSFKILNQKKEEDTGRQRESQEKVSESQLFEVYYLTGISIRKLIYLYYEKYFNINNHQILLSQALVNTSSSFLSSFTKINFSLISKEIIEHYIFRNLISDYLIKITFSNMKLIIIKFKESIERLEYLNTVVFNSDIKLLTKEMLQYHFDYTDHISNYLYENYNTQAQIFDFLCLIIIILPSFKPLILRLFFESTHEAKSNYSQILNKLEQFSILAGIDQSQEERYKVHNISNETINTEYFKRQGGNDNTFSIPITNTVTLKPIIKTELGNVNNNKKIGVVSFKLVDKMKKQGFINKKLQSSMDFLGLDTRILYSLNTINDETELKRKLIFCDFLNNISRIENMIEYSQGMSFIENVLFYQICEYVNYSNHKTINSICIVTTNELIIYEIEGKRFINQKQHMVKVKFDEIDTIFICDYSTRLIFSIRYNEITKENKESESFSLVFNTMIHSFELINYLKTSNKSMNSLNSLNLQENNQKTSNKDKLKGVNQVNQGKTNKKSNIRIVRINSFFLLIQKEEMGDGFISNESKQKHIFNHKQQNKEKLLEEDFHYLKEKENQMSQMRKNLEEINCEFPLNDAIYQSLYSKRVYDHNTNVFLTYFSPSNSKISSDNEYLIRNNLAYFQLQKRIIYISEYYIYIYNELFNKMETLPSEEFILSDQTNNKQYADKMYSFVKKIKLCSIIFYEEEHKTLVIKYIDQSENDNSKIDRDQILKEGNYSLTSIDLCFSDSFDSQLFMNKLDGLLKHKDYDRKIIKETIGIN